MSFGQLQAQRAIWERKPALALVYGVWFEALLKGVPSGARVLELGSGPGFLHHYAACRRRDVRWVSSDLVETPWNDVVADALRLPFRTRSVDAVLALDLVHHLARPALFFSEAARILAPGGQVCVIEPWVTPLSYPVYRLTHPEGCTLHLDPWNPFGAERSADKQPMRGDNAVAWRLVRSVPAARWRELGFRQPTVALFSGLAYLLSLGFRGPSLLPRSFAPLLIEVDRLLAPLAAGLGLRALIQWRRGAGDEPPSDPV